MNKKNLLFEQSAQFPKVLRRKLIPGQEVYATKKI